MEHDQHVQGHTKPSRIAERFSNAKLWLKTLLKEWWRVLKVTKKPDKQEFLTITKVSALGMFFIGLIGFLIQMLKEVLL